MTIYDISFLSRLKQYKQTKLVVDKNLVCSTVNIISLQQIAHSSLAEFSRAQTILCTTKLHEKFRECHNHKPEKKEEEKRTDITAAH